MQNHLYLRPMGFLAGSTAARSVEAGKAGFVAGGPLAFSLVEVIEGRRGSASRRSVSYETIAATTEPEVKAALKCICSKRARIAGVSFERTRIMGVVNVTPDSFSDGGLHDTHEAAIAHAARLIAQGADIIDIGGESTRPGADPVEAKDEAARILPVIKGLRGVKAALSADTRKSMVMAQAAEAGAHIINDISALSHDPESLSVAADTGLPVILMHAQGDPKTMQDDPAYGDVVLEVYDILKARIALCEEAGISRDRIIADPGIGFGKTFEHNLNLLQSISLFHGLGVPVMAGVSRKKFIGTLTGEAEPARRVSGSLGGALAAVSQGVQLLRVHDVKDTVHALAVWQASTMGV